jgi:type I restriction enzyme R subunit
LHDINPEVPACGIEDAIRKITSTASPDFVVNNRAFHRFLTEGIDVEISADAAYGGLRTVKVWLLDLEDIDNNNWLALNQFTVVENGVDEH